VIRFDVFGRRELLRHFIPQPVFANLNLSIRLSGVVSLFCFYRSARTESEYDILKYGDDYRECMRRVPMWNITRGIIKEREDELYNE